jgi:heavy metal sensor kinase
MLQRDSNGGFRLGDGTHFDDESLGFLLVVQASDASVLGTVPAEQGPTWRAAARPDWTGARTLPDGSGEPWRIFSSVERVAGQDLVLHVGRSELPLRDDLRGLVTVLLLMLPLAVAVSCLGGWLLARRALAPMTQLAEHARRISAERLGARLPIANARDEVGRLALVFNEMLARLDRSFAQLRRFTADASHELRTPLTALRAVGEVGMQRDHDAAGCRDVIASMLEEVDRMTQLVDSLLLLARSDSGAVPRDQRHLDLAALAREVAATLAVLAEEKHQRIAVNDTGPAPVYGDPTLLRLAVINVLGNAIKHSSEGGTIDLRTTTADGFADCTVRDSGPGIAAEHQARIFERFYRADDARARATGGAGLGLALARAVVEQHGGSVQLLASDATGSEFRIRLPSSPAAE